MIRLAVRALVLDASDRLLIVNAYPGGESDLWCAPGGGAEPHKSLPDNLVREVHEETGLVVDVGPLRLVNEFHARASGFHQVDLFFRCYSRGNSITPEWVDPDGVVSRRRFVCRNELRVLRHRPGSLAEAAWGIGVAPIYDPLETLVR